MLRWFLAPAAFAALFALTACNAPDAVFAHYDACATKSESFPVVAACGKQARNAACSAAQSCTAIGNAAVQYADALAAGVRRGELSNANAWAQWAQFKVAQLNVAQQLAIENSMLMAASMPRVCAPFGYYRAFGCF